MNFFTFFFLLFVVVAVENASREKKKKEKNVCIPISKSKEIVRKYQRKETFLQQ